MSPDRTSVWRDSKLLPVTLVPSVTNVAQNLPVGARLNQFWETWAALGAGPKIIQMLKEGYILPFQTRPNLKRSPTIISCYVYPHLDQWRRLTTKIRELLTGFTCPVWQLMTLKGQLTATEKQVHLGRLHTVAPQKQLEGPRVTSKGDSQVAPPTCKMVAGGKQCAPRSTITSTKTCSAAVYRCILRRLGRSLK